MHICLSFHHKTQPLIFRDTKYITSIHLNYKHMLTKLLNTRYWITYTANMQLRKIAWNKHGLLHNFIERLEAVKFHRQNVVCICTYIADI